ncbi:RCC1 domain-containing protein, partial [Helicobacter typhlonius]|uniref:RCC1 domain-containing protein n=1 Tax=Helicobacter typhlonius TaxID=76936 RepID=UPI002FE349CD
STVSELSGQEIVWVSGKYKHFLAVSREGRVFGRGSNSRGELGLGQQTSSISSFTEISSLKGHKIRAAYAGCYHSLFETREGKILACGYKGFSCLLLSSDTHENVYSPTETTITDSAAFCIAGYCSSTVFIGGDPPPNTPNRLIEKFE